MTMSTETLRALYGTWRIARAANEPSSRLTTRVKRVGGPHQQPALPSARRLRTPLGSLPGGRDL